MADEQGRSSRDIEAVRDIAAKFDRPLMNLAEQTTFPQAGLDRFAPQISVLDGLLQQVQDYEGLDRLVLGNTRELELLGDLTAAARLVSFARQANLPGVCVYNRIDNVYGAGALFDVFSRRARISVSGPDTPDFENLQDIRGWVENFSGRSPDLVLVEPMVAVNQFLTLFVDTLRGIGRAFKSRTAAALSFTVHSSNSGYLLESHPQYRYSPVGFGSNASTPVVGSLGTGHFCFQGWLNGAVTKDPGVYFSGPGSNSAHLKAF